MIERCAFLTRVPMSPSANALYSNLAPRPGKKFGGRWKSKDYEAFLLRCHVWGMAHHHEVQLARSMVLQCSDKALLHVSADFYFHKKSIFTLDGRPKRNDTANRLKALHDAIAQIIRIDDSHFWSGTFNKHVTELEGEYVDVKVEMR